MKEFAYCIDYKDSEIYTGEIKAKTLEEAEQKIKENISIHINEV